MGISKTAETFGALDLGGASTQITFVPEKKDELKPEYYENLLLYGQSYDVYTHSYLCYGANEAQRKLEAELVKVGSVIFHILFLKHACTSG